MAAFHSASDCVEFLLTCPIDVNAAPTIGASQQAWRVMICVRPPIPKTDHEAAAFRAGIGQRSISSRSHRVQVMLPAAALLRRCLESPIITTIKHATVRSVCVEALPTDTLETVMATSPSALSGHVPVRGLA